MKLDGLLEFLRSHRLAVQASVFSTHTPQAALVGYAVSNRLEIIFDTLSTSRKAANLRQNPSIALVIGGWQTGHPAGDERTVQYQGLAAPLTGQELECLLPVYYAAWPDAPARAAWPGLMYFRVRPTWIRYSDFNQSPPLIVEFDQAELSCV